MSILRRLQLSFITLGLAMGLIFPVYAQFFVEWKEGMFTWFAAGCLVAGACIGIINFWLLKKLLLVHLQQVAYVSRAIVNKDLSQRCTVQSNDTIGLIISNVNNMADTLQNTFSNINNVSSSCSEAIGSLSQKANSTSQKTKEQHEVTGEVLNVMNALSNAANEINAQTQLAFETSQSTKSQAQSGSDRMDVAMQAMNSLSNQSEEATIVITQLKDHGGNIGNVLTSIQEISEQTNLLALNAAIEAARAGEQGRGFAVVADEVRALATRTQQSTSEINDMIARLQGDTEQAVNIISKGKDLAAKSLNEMQTSQSSLSEILTAINNIESINTSICESVTDQTDHIENSRNNVESLLNSTAANSASTDQARELCSGLQTQINTLCHQIEGYRLK